MIDLLKAAALVALALVFLLGLVVIIIIIGGTRLKRHRAAMHAIGTLTEDDKALIRENLENAVENADPSFFLGPAEGIAADMLAYADCPDHWTEANMTPVIEAWLDELRP